MATTMTKKLMVALASFAVCFIVGASLSVLWGLDSKTWVPAGVVTSTVVAMQAFIRRPPNRRNTRRTD